MANHYNRDALYWGPARIGGWRRSVYQILNFRLKSKQHAGHIEGDESFWGDACRSPIRYCRNFVFPQIDTLSACSFMPYHDPERPFVNQWYASSEGSRCSTFTAMLKEAAQDQLEAASGACVMYTHFGHGFVENGKIDQRFRRLMERLSRKNGWFVPVGTLLDYLRSQRGEDHVVSPLSGHRLKQSGWPSRCFAERLELFYRVAVRIVAKNVTSSSVVHVIKGVTEGETDVEEFRSTAASVSGKPLELSPPLKGERWVTMNGPSNDTHHRRSVIPVQGRLKVPQRYAI
ncbi:MAG: hypothetical protein WKF37_11885, partial [Bryobacteraceae bacterium]